MVIGGEDRKLKFGINQTDIYCKLKGITLAQYQEFISDMGNENYSIGDFRDLVWSALKDGARLQKVEFNYSNFDVGDWIDERPEAIGEITAELIGNMPDPSSDEDAPKKKQ